jgi:adenylosuccinate synthase
MPGWQEKTSNLRHYRELPLRARRYIEKIAQLVECPVALISVGSERHQVILVNQRSLKWLKSV